MSASNMDNGSYLGAGYRARNEWTPPPPLSWWVRYPNLATAVLAIALVLIGMGLERLSQ